MFHVGLRPQTLDFVEERVSVRLTAVCLFLQADADSFYTACNGRQFNSIEDAVCQMVYVERAEVIKSEEVNRFSISILIIELLSKSSWFIYNGKHHLFSQ